MLIVYIALMLICGN